MKNRLLVFLLMWVMVAIQANGQIILFEEDFESAPNPNNNTAPVENQWYCGSENAAASCVSVKHDGSNLLTTTPEGTDGSGNPTGYSLRTGYAYDDVSIRYIIGNVKWDQNKNYTLLFRHGSTDHSYPAANFQVMLRAWSDNISTLIKPAIYLTPQLNKWNTGKATLTGAEIAAAGVDGQLAQLYFYKPTNCDFIYLDDILLVEGIVPDLIEPADKAKNIPVNQELAWSFDEVTAGYTPNKFVLYYRGDNTNWSEPNTVVIDPATSPVTPDPDFQLGTTYYWRVDTYEPNTTGPDIVNEGLVWRFGTVPPSPVIDRNPLDQLADPGSDPVISLAARNPYTNDSTGLSYQWYWNDGTTETPVGDSASDLVLPDIQEANEGLYFCVVTLDSNGQTAESEKAMLGVKTRDAYWTLNQSDFADGSHTDISGHSRDAAINGATATFVPGADGLENGAVQVDDSNWATAGAWDTFDYGDEMTISLWLKWDGSDTSDPVICKRDGYTVDLNRWTLEIASGQVRLAATRTGSDELTGYYVPSDEWIHVEFVVDGVGYTLYVNSEQKWHRNLWVADNNVNAPIYIGRYDLSNPTLFHGQLDDIRIYNYARTEYQVVEDYYDLSGISRCVANPAYDFTGPEGVPDCVVDLYDLAWFTRNWLESNRVGQPQ